MKLGKIFPSLRIYDFFFYFYVEKKPGMEKKEETKKSNIISLRSKGTYKSSERSAKASTDRSVSKDKGDKSGRMIYLNRKPGNAEGRGWQSGSGWMRNHQIGYFKSRNIKSHSNEQVDRSLITYLVSYFLIEYVVKIS